MESPKKKESPQWNRQFWLGVAERAHELEAEFGDLTDDRLDEVLWEADEGREAVRSEPPSLGDAHLTPGQVARILHVSPKTVIRWANEGKLPCTLTLGGHRRFLRDDLEKLLAKPEEHPT